MYFLVDMVDFPAIVMYFFYWRGYITLISISKYRKLIELSETIG